jgi:hypothetical protein
MFPQSGALLHLLSMAEDEDVVELSHLLVLKVILY